LKFSWDNLRTDGSRALARLDRFYIFTTNHATAGRKVLDYTIKGEATRSDHSPVFASVQLEDRPHRATKWKMNSYYLDEAQPTIIELWNSLPEAAPFFSKLRQILQFYRAYYKKRAAEARADEDTLKWELEAATADLQANINELPAQIREE
jgi:hypothetical protein